MKLDSLPILDTPSFVRKVKCSDIRIYVRILVRPNFSVTGDGEGLADCKKAIILDGANGHKLSSTLRNTERLHPLLVYNYVGGLMNFQSNSVPTS